LYLKCQLDLDTCHYLIVSRVLADIILLTWNMMMWDLIVLPHVLLHVLKALAFG